MFFEDVLRKSDFIRTFEVVAGLIDVSDGQTVLELGASHSWASVLVKCDFPGAYVVRAASSRTACGMRLVMSALSDTSGRNGRSASAISLSQMRSLIVFLHLLPSIISVTVATIRNL